MNPKYCYSCGTPLVPGGSYCPECGRYQPPLAVNPFIAASVPPPAQAEAKTSPAMRPQPGSKEKEQPPRAEAPRPRGTYGLRARQWFMLFCAFVLVPLTAVTVLAYAASARNSAPGTDLPDASRPGTVQMGSGYYVPPDGEYLIRI